MATKKRKRRAARIAALTVTLLIAATWFTSIWILVLAKPTKHLLVAIHSGGVGFSTWRNSILSDDDEGRFRLLVNEASLRWLPTWGTENVRLRQAIRFTGYLPLWIPLLNCIVATVVVFRRTRVGPGGCGWCGYDLTGNVSGVCPECGMPTAEDENRPVDG